MQEAILITKVVYSSIYRAREAIVGYFYVEIAVYQNVFKLYVSMGYSTLMNSVQAVQDFPKDVPTSLFVKRPEFNEVVEFTIFHVF